MRMDILLVGMTMMLLLALPAAASDYTLDIFGNANEDETINMQDVTYTELIILEYRDRTELADGKHDGKINMQDVTQIELVILGKEKELTFLDIFGEAVTVNKPIERLANLGMYGPQIARMLGAKDILLPVIGLESISEWAVFYPEISKWQVVGWKHDSCDFEKILSLGPDAVQTNLEARWALRYWEEQRLIKEKLPGIPVISLNLREPDVLLNNIRIYGYILDRKDEAEAFCDWYTEVMDTITSRTEDISEDEKPTFFIAGTEIYNTKSSVDRRAMALVLAGGKNIVDELSDLPTHGMIIVDPEWVAEQNPEYIFRIVHPGTSELSGYMQSDTSAVEAVRQEIMNQPILANTDAVKNGHVYIIDGHLCDGGGNTAIGAAYAAKLFYPDLFEDMDPQTVHLEYVDNFCQINFDVSEHGVFWYPPL